MPLTPGGALASGDVARALVQRLVSGGGAVRGVVAEDVLVVLGDVPWVDGLTWLGQDEAARGLWLPTWQAPTVPVGLVGRAVAGTVGLPAVLLPDLVVSVVEAAPFDLQRLQRWAS